MNHQERMDIICGLVAEIFERDPKSLNGATRLMTDLPCESIDLLEIGAGLGQVFHVAVDDDVVFLRSLRTHLEQDGDPQAILHREYPYLSAERCAELARSVQTDAAPQLCLADIDAYIAALVS